MKIHTNSFGNYNPIKTQNRVAVNNNHKVKDNIKITNEEKNFFTKLYPNQKDTIENYHFYDKKGDINGNSLGSLFDRRG